MPRVAAAYRRQDFVEAAVRVIADHGAANATTRRIAAEAGAPLASLHYVFHTKDDLFQAVYDALIEQTLQPATEYLQGLSFGELAAWQLRTGTEWMMEHPAYARAQAELFYWALNNNRAIARAPYQMSLKSAVDFLAAATNGRVPTSVLDAVARLNLCMVDGLLTAWFALDDNTQLRKDLDCACRSVALFAEAQLAAAMVPAQPPGAQQPASVAA